VLGKRFDCAAGCWDRYLMCSVRMEPIVECGAVCWDRELSLESWIGTEY